MRIPFQALRAFIEVVETGSFTKAAENLFITQPAISKSIKELESLFDVKLIDRAYLPVLLTDSGVSLYNLGKNIFTIEHAIIQDLTLRSQAKVGNLTIGASTTVASHWLSPYLVNYSIKFPDINISVLSGNSQHIIDNLKKCEIDIGLIEGPVINEPDIEVREWQKERLLLVTSTTFMSNTLINDLSQVKWIMREDGSGTARVTDEYLNRYHIKPRSIVRVGNNLAVLNLVYAGLGVALLPEIMVKDGIKENKLQNLHVSEHDNFIERELNWITLKWRNESPIRKAFKELIFN
ncbi:LysR family transcriptional regulator [Ferrovum sp. PN-J185]|uniref:LysR family transcriptional regulator n=1 Tax=Ferrovum sp. PN-J185 TaxID=1356306 RepID=UPI001E32FBF9|nr:LysR family transcriptional regulator [Ferrovum sp. PN-J185]MCC6068007.1 LysR family transcriptional regulator [Ferrovum sp. PN-J185]